MDSGVHVWSTPLGYCDDAEAEDIIKDEEEISEEQQDGYYCPEPSDPLADPLGLAGDQLSVGGISPGDRLDSVGSAESELTASSAEPHSRPAVAPATVFLVPDEAVDEDGDDPDPAEALWFKAEPEQLTEPAQYTAGVSAAPRTHSRRVRRGQGGGVGDDGGDGAAGLHADPSPSVDRPSLPPPLRNALIDPDSGRELYTCVVCQRSFKWKQQLTQHHYERHPDLKPYKCSECGGRFRRPAFLREHRKLHSNEPAYTCGICGRGFATLSRLRMHKKVPRSCSASDSSIKIVIL